MKSIRKNFLHIKLLIISLLFCPFISTYPYAVFSSQENYFEEIDLNNPTKDEYESNNSIPTNPFEIVDMLRKVNSMNDATIPSDAIDDAIKSFDNLNLKNK